jgi:hypothetical protein
VENNNTDTSGVVHGNNSDINQESSKAEGIVNKEKNNTPMPDTSKSNADAQKKSSTKKKPVIKTVQKTEDVKSENIMNYNPDPVKIDEGLLLIDEGNFKYRRIPDIKLIDTPPVLVEKNIKIEAPIEPEQKKEKSYIDIWKIIIILIIVGIFILYVSRASGSPKVSNKTSRSRKVMNSYRK